jgi:hypothetical protein
MRFLEYSFLKTITILRMYLLYSFFTVFTKNTQQLIFHSVEPNQPFRNMDFITKIMNGNILEN